MWNPSAQHHGPNSGPETPMFGWAMTARTSAQELRRAGLLSRRDFKEFKTWLAAGAPQPEPGTTISKTVWAVWFWQMMPGNWELH